MNGTESAHKRCIVFVLASWQPDAPAGIERATAALALGLAATGHRAVIATAVMQAAIQKDGPGLPGVLVEHLDLPVTFPCEDDTLREVITSNEEKIQAQLWDIIGRHQADTVVFTDALWGLGCLRADLPKGIRRILTAHVVAHAEDLGPALSRADAVVIPSPVVQAEATRAGWTTRGWRIVPNALLHQLPEPNNVARLVRRQNAPVRVLARPGPEKGIVPLLTAVAGSKWPRRLEVVLAPAGFEETGGSQHRLLNECQAIADAAPNITLDANGLPWDEVPGWLARAAVVIVPSLRETFGLVALEAMSVGTPVIAYRIGNLPALLESAQRGRQLLGDPMHGPHTLLHLADELLADPLGYERTSKAMYHLSQDYGPVRIAQLFSKAVS